MLVYLIASSVICSSHVYDESEYENSLVSATDLGTCGDYDDWPLYPVITRASLLSTGTAIGMFFGAFPLGLLSDKFGRKDVMIANVFLAFAFLLGSAFCQNYWSELRCEKENVPVVFFPFQKRVFHLPGEPSHFVSSSASSPRVSSTWAALYSSR